MSISFGAPATSAEVNAAFASRTEEQTIDGGKTFQKFVGTEKEDVATAASITALSSAKSLVKMTGSTATSLHGILAGENGQHLVIYNASSAAVTLKHQSGSASAANRIKIFGGADLIIPAEAFSELKYDSSQSLWIVSVAAHIANATDLSTASTLVKRDSNSKASFKGLALDGSTSGTLTINPAATITNHTYTLPDAQGGAGTYLKNNGSGALTWETPGSSAFAWNVTPQTSAYTAAAGDLVKCTSGTFAVTLPTAVGISGQKIAVKNVGTGTISMATTASQTIDDAAPAINIYPGDYFEFISDNSGWLTA